MNNDELRKQVNKSGFPFQWKIEDLVNTTTRDHGWRVEAPEHAWKNPDTGDAGFIDIVLANERYIFKLVVECKRPSGGEWIFLLDKDTRLTDRLRIHWNSSTSDHGWYDFRFSPRTFESSVCMVAGQTPMLERLSWELLGLTYALSLQELAIRQRGGGGGTRRIYIPAIVTAARLKACYVDRGKISLEGQVEVAKFEDVLCIRFRKSLANDLTPDANPVDLREENVNKERTILVINSHHLLSVIQEIKLQPPGDFESYPWDKIARSAPAISTDSRFDPRIPATSYDPRR